MRSFFRARQMPAMNDCCAISSTYRILGLRTLRVKNLTIGAPIPGTGTDSNDTRSVSYWYLVGLPPAVLLHALIGVA